jgi:hypothetical protein
MTDIRSFFRPAAAASAPSAPPPDTKRGRPVSGAGSRGGVVAHKVRDGKGRVRKRNSTDDAVDGGDGDADDDSDSPSPKRRKNNQGASRVNWSHPENQERLEQAMRLHQQGHTLRVIESRTDVPRSVIQTRIKGKCQVAAHVGKPTSLTTKQESELASYLIDMADCGFGKDVCEIRVIAAKMSTNSKFKATTRWWQRFKQRHPELSRRRAQGFERLRAIAMNPSLIKQYFLLLTSAFAKIAEMSGGMQLTADRIFNMDEIGFQISAGKMYVVARKGSKHVASISYNCRVTTSLAVAVSASGYVIPPFFIVKGQRSPGASYLAAAPPHSAMAMAKKGMMTEDVFAQWVEHFVKHLQRKDERHWCLLLLDGHHSHTMNPRVLKLLYDNRVYVISLPSHTTAALQLLDVAVFGPLKRAFRQFVHEWRDLNPNELMDRRQIPNVMSGIWTKGILPETIVKGAASTGLYPLNPNWVAENACKFKISQTFSQPSLPGTISFANFTSSHRSLAALDLMLSPEQSKSLFHRIYANGKLPRLNALGESAAASRLLNSELRVKKLFELSDLKMKQVKEKAEKKKQRAAKRDATRASKLKKQYEKDKSMEQEKPLLEILIEHGYQTAKDGKPTMAVLRTFAKRNKLSVKGTRAAVVKLLLDAVMSSTDRQWKPADEQEEEEEEENSESEQEEKESPSSEDSEDSDIDDWSGTRVFC